MAPTAAAGPIHDAGAGEADAAPLAIHEEAYGIDTEYTEEDASLAIVKDIGPVKYFGIAALDGVPIEHTPGGEEGDVLWPGDVVAAQVPEAGDHVRLLDGRGWLKVSEDVVEVDPWAARVMKKPGVDKIDAAALAYLSVDEEKLAPLAQHLPLPQRVVDELGRRGIRKASPIQEAVFDKIHRGESMCLQSMTGSGKTLAMMLPLLTAMSEETVWGEQGDKIFVVTASRELAVQLYSDIENMGFFPPNQGYATTIIVGNIPDVASILKANVIIGTPNELGGVLHKDNALVQAANAKLRAIVMDEVDQYTTAPRIFGSPLKIKRKRRIYNEQKQGLTHLDDTGKIEWFVKRALAYSRRKDLQVLAASATLSRPMARKVFRLLRWDPLGRWYNKPPPLMRPLNAMGVDFQAVPRVPTVPQHLDHRYVQVVKYHTDTNITMKHFNRKPYAYGGLARLKVRAAGGQRRILGSGIGQRPVSPELAASLLDGLHDTLKSRGPGSCMVIICDTVGVTLRDTVRQLRAWGFNEAVGIYNEFWDDPDDWVSRWAQHYTHDQRDHSLELAEKHRELNKRLRAQQPRELPVGHPKWRAREERKARGESVAPVLVGCEGNGRGLHFDGIETVYILGLPRKPEIYMHMAGRAGRLGQNGGKVVSIVPKRSAKVLHAWRKKLGPEVEFSEEPIVRDRSQPMPAEYTERLRQLPEPREEATDDEDEASIPLLGPGEQHVPMPGVPGYDPEEREMVRIRELVGRTRTPKDDIKARRIAARLAQVINPI